MENNADKSSVTNDKNKVKGGPNTISDSSKQVMGHKESLIRLNHIKLRKSFKSVNQVHMILIFGFFL
jgi:hypothetical protein